MNHRIRQSSDRNLGVSTQEPGFDACLRLRPDEVSSNGEGSWVVSQSNAKASST